MADTGGNSYVLHDTAIIRAALEKRTELLQRYNRIKEDYKKAINHLNENWKGEGADAFRKDESKIGKNIENIFDILKSMSDMLEDCLEIIEQKDKALGAYNADPK